MSAFYQFGSRLSRLKVIGVVTALKYRAYDGGVHDLARRFEKALHEHGRGKEGFSVVVEAFPSTAFHGKGFGKTEHYAQQIPHGVVVFQTVEPSGGYRSRVRWGLGSTFAQVGLYPVGDCQAFLLSRLELFLGWGHGAVSKLLRYTAPFSAPFFHIHRLFRLQKQDATFRIFGVVTIDAILVQCR